MLRYAEGKKVAQPSESGGILSTRGERLAGQEGTYLLRGSVQRAPAPSKRAPTTAASHTITGHARHHQARHLIVELGLQRYDPAEEGEEGRQAQTVEGRAPVGRLGQAQLHAAQQPCVDGEAESGLGPRQGREEGGSPSSDSSAIPAQ